MMLQGKGESKFDHIGIIDSAKEWLTLRELRNIIAHEYSDKTIVEGIKDSLKHREGLLRFMLKFIDIWL